MNSKGASTIGVILIILISIVAVSILLSVVFRNIRNVTAEERAKCLGIDLKATLCTFFPSSTVFPNSNYVLPANGILALVERGYGGGGIADLRFHLEYSDGSVEILSPINLSAPGFRINTEYQNFVEHSSKEAVLMPITYTPSRIPSNLRVSAVVGKSNTLCEATAPALPCTVIAPPVVP